MLSSKRRKYIKNYMGGLPGFLLAGVIIEFYLSFLYKVWSFLVEHTYDIQEVLVES